MHAIVGNGPLSAADRKLISNAGHITRFNLTPNLNGEQDARTDELFLSTSSKQIGEYLQARAFEKDQAFQCAQRIVLPFHPDIVRRYMQKPRLLSRLKGRRADWSDLCVEIASDFGKDTEILGVSEYLSACETLGIDPEAKYFVPSSGFLAVQRLVELLKPKPGELHLFGFGFAGWKRHNWQAEEAHILDLQADKVIKVHPVLA